MKQPQLHPSQLQQDQHSSSDVALLDNLNMDDRPDQHCQQRPQQPQLLTNNALFVLVHSNVNSSASDLDTPLTPTFSSHGGNHLRYASSTSSLDLQQSYSTCSDSSVSPTQPPQSQTLNPVNASPSPPTSVKRLLPDVQEDPFERDDHDDDESTMDTLTDEQLESLYDCLCMSRSTAPELKIHD